MCELTCVLDRGQPKVSRHLGQLRQAGVVESRRRGTWRHYRLHSDLADWAGAIIIDMAASQGESLPFVHDPKAFRAMPNRLDTAFWA